MSALSTGAFVDLLLGQRPTAAREAALAMVDGGKEPRSMYLDVLAPALQEVGARWQQGAASVAQEHLATAIVASIMVNLAPRFEKSPSTALRGLLACTDGELHDVGLRMVGDFLEADGWEVMYVGPATPGTDLAGLATKLEPHLVGLSTTLTTHLVTASAAIAELKSLPVPPAVLVGGRAYGDDPGIAALAGADLFAPDAETASQAIRARFRVA
ncbi:MAG: cobalamin-dependent protein [Chloroflexota bacterium]